MNLFIPSRDCQELFIQYKEFILKIFDDICTGFGPVERGHAVVYSENCTLYTTVARAV